MLTTLINRLPAGAVASALMLFGPSCQFIEPGNFHRSSAEQSELISSCAVGHLLVDAFGYPTCVTSDDENTGIASQAVPEPIETSSPVPSQATEDSSPIALGKKSVEENDEWHRGDFACRRRVHDSLASPYGIYEQCMQDKGLSSASP